MEEQKNNELTDESLDTVTGGAHYEWNEGTGKYDVYAADGKKIVSCSTQLEASKFTLMMNTTERPIRPSVLIPQD